MKNAVKIPLIIAGILVALGLIVLIVGYAVGGTAWLFKTGNYVDKTIDVEGSFNSIRIESDSCDVRFAVAEDGKCRVEAHLQESMTLSAEVDNDDLVIKCKDKRKWFQFIGIQSRDSKMTVYLPETEYESLKLGTASGDVAVSNSFSFHTTKIATASGDIDLQAAVRDSLEIATSSGDLSLAGLNGSASVKLATSSGDFVLNNLDCGDLVVTLSSGDLKAGNINAAKLTVKGASTNIHLDHVICSGDMNITTASGDIGFTKCDAANVKIDTASGDVAGSFVTEKVFSAHTASGDVRIPQDGNGGSCRINTASGDIYITIAG